jgi:hypothetical protein
MSNADSSSTGSDLFGDEKSALATCEADVGAHRSLRFLLALGRGADDDQQTLHTETKPYLRNAVAPRRWAFIRYARKTGLSGWGGRTRTGESVRALSDWNGVTTSPDIGQVRRQRRFECKLRDTPRGGRRRRPWRAPGICGQGGSGGPAASAGPG